MFDLMSQHRTVYAIDLPGYGTSERSDRLYTPRLMTDAILDLASYIRVQHGDKPIDAMAASLSCEFLARAAVAFCPTSNLFLGSGLFDFGAAAQAGAQGFAACCRRGRCG